MSIVLIGYRGSGKTTIGRKLAQRLEYPFVDSDDLIVGQAMQSIREIFAQRGESSFRDLESAVVQQAATLRDHVIALGGGAMGRAENRAAIQAAGHTIVHLHCESPELLRRIRSDPASVDTRPNLTSLAGGIEEINIILAERQPIWREVCHAELDVTHLSPDEAVEYTIKLLKLDKKPVS